VVLGQWVVVSPQMGVIQRSGLYILHWVVDTVRLKHVIQMKVGLVGQVVVVRVPVVHPVVRGH